MKPRTVRLNPHLVARLDETLEAPPELPVCLASRLYARVRRRHGAQWRDILGSPDRDARREVRLKFQLLEALPE